MSSRLFSKPDLYYLRHIRVFLGRYYKVSSKIFQGIQGASKGGSKGGSRGGTKRIQEKQMLAHFWFVTWQNDENIKVHQRVRSPKNRGVCRTVFEVRACVRRTLKYIATQRMITSDAKKC